MAFTLPPVERASVHLDIAFHRAKIKAELVKKKLKRGKLTIHHIREIERARFKMASEALVKRITKIHRSFPEIEKLSVFYQELMKATLDVEQMQKSLAGLLWLERKIAELTKQHLKKLNRCSVQTAIHTLRSAFYGRLSSVCTKLDNEFVALERARKAMKIYPILRDLPTVAIAGFPNVGKTTLLSKLSSSTPEIAEYAFTTKHINLGYIQFGHKKIQLLDTPGTLARPDTMNAIEKQAMLAVKYLAHVIVYVFDPTEPYPLDKQEQLLEILKKENKPLLLYISKSDLTDQHVQKTIAELKEKHKEIISSAELLKQSLQKLEF